MTIEHLNRLNQVHQNYQGNSKKPALTQAEVLLFSQLETAKSRNWDTLYLSTDQVKVLEGMERKFPSIKKLAKDNLGLSSPPKPTAPQPQHRRSLEGPSGSGVSTASGDKGMVKFLNSRRDDFSKIQLSHDEQLLLHEFNAQNPKDMTGTAKFDVSKGNRRDIIKNLAVKMNSYRDSLVNQNTIEMLVAISLDDKLNKMDLSKEEKSLLKEIKNNVNSKYEKQVNFGVNLEGDRLAVLESLNRKRPQQQSGPGLSGPGLIKI